MNEKQSESMLEKLPNYGSVSPSEAKMDLLFDKFLGNLKINEFIIEQLKPDLDDTRILAPNEFQKEITKALNAIRTGTNSDNSPEFLDLKSQVESILMDELDKSQQLSNIRHSLLLG